MMHFMSLWFNIGAITLYTEFNFRSVSHRFNKKSKIKNTTVSNLGVFEKKY